jgi:hypothetical protein
MSFKKFSRIEKAVAILLREYKEGSNIKHNSQHVEVD